jgi:DNA helicase HerA-like ATPase
VFFFDEAHLLFRDASKAFLTEVEQVVRLIRSKGVGIYFVTQTPKDVPEEVLAQLSNRVQHALRAHTPDDEKALAATVRTFPRTTLVRSQGSSDIPRHRRAVVTVLDPRGVPTPVFPTRLIPPASRMGPLTPEELQADVNQSDLLAEYGKAVDRESAREMLAARMAQTRPAPPIQRQSAPQRQPPSRAGKSAGGALIGALSTTIGRTVGREIIRGVFGMLGVKPPRSTTRRTRW